ncbi:sulfotransferase [Myxococcota bacterium]|nr:sulfotransferase [Myxococcota bacterium]
MSPRLEKELYLHVGYPRTGTTTLQHNVFVRHPEISYIGKPLHYFSKKISGFFSILMERPTLEYERGLDDFITTIVDPLLEKKPERKVLISEEELSTGRITGADRGVVARRLHHLFPKAKILVTLRRQEDVLASLYCHLRAEGMLPNVPFPRWIEQQRRRISVDAVFTRFDYATILDEYARLFGAENVHVQLYEDFAADPHAWLRAFARPVGLDPDKTAALLDTADPDAHRNQRLSKRELAWQDARKLVPKLPPLDQLTKGRAQETLRSWLADGEKIEAHWGPEERAFIREHYAPGNRAVADRFGLALAPHGYALNPR